MAVYPSNKARIGAKLQQNAFQTICNFSFFDPEKKNLDKQILEVDFFKKKLAFWRSYEFLSVRGTSVVESYCLWFIYF